MFRAGDTEAKTRGLARCRRWGTVTPIAKRFDDIGNEVTSLGVKINGLAWGVQRGNRVPRSIIATRASPDLEGTTASRRSSVTRKARGQMAAGRVGVGRWIERATSSSSAYETSNRSGLARRATIS